MKHERFANCRLIAAVGNYGQLGNNGRLPWHNKADLQFFKQMTMGGICVVGKNTAATLPPLPGREVYVWQRTDKPKDFANAHSDRDIWICGGATIYNIWKRHVWQSIITHINYDGPADVIMPFLWMAPHRFHTR